MTTLCWIDIPDGWRCEIMTSAGEVKPWDPSKPIGPTCRYRAWDQQSKRYREDDPWLLPGEYEGATLAEWREAVAASAGRAEYRAKNPGKK
jgi:hypothetical protein